MIFEVGGKTYTLIADEDWLLKETREVEQWIGLSGLGEQGIVTRYGCLAAVSIARVEPGITITSWLDSASNKVVLDIYQQIQRQADAEAQALAAEDAALEASGVVLSPTSAASVLPGELAAPSSESSSNAGGSPL